MIDLQKNCRWGRRWRPALATLAIGGTVATSCTFHETQPEHEYEIREFWGEADSGGPELRDPFGISVDPRSGKVLVTDSRNHRVVVFDQDGDLVNEFGEEGDGAGHLRRPVGVGVGPAGSIYVADAFRDTILRFTETGEFLSEWGAPGEGRDQFQTPYGMAIDAAGDVYVADFQNMAIKVFNKDGDFLEEVGGPGELHYPTAVALAEDGSLLVADAYNYRIQRFEQPREKDKTDIQGHLFSPPEKSSLEFNVPSGVAWDSANRLLHVADSGNGRVVMLDETGRYVNEWALPDPTGEHSPAMVAVSPDGRHVYATDIANDRVIVLNIK